MYFLFVETKNKTLEELDDVFEAKNPRKASVLATKIQERPGGDVTADNAPGEH